ncbi:hypothetical protein FACS1894163_05120 [Spirochaetia bacterium]|nr:hypothetical protein FACS1894163_05120 [Spirochaetia bacterium]
MVETNLIEAYDLLMEFIAKHTMDKFFLMGDQRVSVRSWIAREVVSNILVHREYTSTFPAKIVIENERMYAENWNRSYAQGRIDPDNFTPRPKNPLLARFFVNIGRADQLGSGVRNLYKYTQIYSGSDPELIEGDVFRTIIPLLSAVDETDYQVGMSDKTPGMSDKTPGMSDKMMERANSKLTISEIAFLESILPLFAKHEWINTTLVNELSDKSPAAIRRYLKRLSDINVLEARGANKNREYRLQSGISI